MSFQRHFCKAVAKIIEDDETIKAAGNVTVAIEDEVSAADTVRRQLGKLGVLALIATTGHARQSGSGQSTAGDMTFEITLFENPKLNRATNPEAFTLTAAAETIASALHWRLIDGQHRMRYQSMQRADADETDARMIIAFAAYRILDAGKAAYWGIGKRTIWGEVVNLTREKGGETLFELGRDGKAKFTGVADEHEAITLTCLVDESCPKLPNLGDEFVYEDLTYLTTSAKLDESGENTSTVTLSGRTLTSNL